MNTTTNHEISLQLAIDMTTRYQANRPRNFPVSETFDKAAIEKLLVAPGCASLRIYYGMNQNLLSHAILVAVDASGADILPAANTTATATDGPVILEDALRCPDLCPPKSALNK